MATITNSALLSPALMFKQIEATHGSPIFDTFSYLDPARAQAQINAAFLALKPMRHNSHLDKGATDPGWTPVALAQALGFSN